MKMPTTITRIGISFFTFLFNNNKQVFLVLLAFVLFISSFGQSHIFHSTDVPAVQLANDFSTNGGITGIEVGVKFQSSQSGYITGIRYYRGDGVSGIHTGHLWNPAVSTTTPLASVTFTGESCSGWQLAVFSTPVSINANTTYVASCFSSSGDYSYTNSAFGSAVTNGPLTALVNNHPTDPNGIYIYSSTSAFPSSSGNSTNYWVDVDFVTSISGSSDVTPPTILGTSPTNNYTDAGADKSIIVLFNEDIDPGTVSTSTFELRDATNSLVARSVAYNPLSKMAVLTPSFSLTSSALYTAKIKGGSSGVKDMAGNALAADHSWSFTVTNRQHLLFDEGFEGVCPFGAFTTGQDANHPWSRQQAGDIPANEGLHSFRAEVRDGSDGFVSDGWRSEVKPQGITDDGEKWYGMSLYLDVPQSGGNWTGSFGGSLVQWHPNNDYGSGTLWLDGTQGTWDLVTNPVGEHDTRNHNSAINIAADVWHDIVFHVNWTTGIVQVWIDGVLLWDLADGVASSYYSQEHLDFTSGPGQYMKFGMNRWGTGTPPDNPPNDTWIIYYDNLRIGDEDAGYCDVAPELNNDDAPGAFTLTVGSGCSGAAYTNNCSTKSAGEVTLKTCSGNIEAPVWFKFVAPSSGAIRISTDIGSGNTFADSKVSLFSATDVSDYSTFNIIACDDDGGSSLSSGNMSVVYATGLTNGQTYYIAVDKHGSVSTTGTFCITVDELSSSMLATSNNCSNTYQTPTANGNSTYTGWQPLVDANSKLIALVRNPTGGGVDAYNVAQNINGSGVRQDATSGQYYLDRNYRINNSASATNVEVQFFFLSSELTALQAADNAATLASLKVTRQTGSTCQNDFATANGTNSELVQTGNGSVNGVSWIKVTTPGFSNFYIHSTKTAIITKAFLQGAYNSSLSRHKDVSTTWRDILNANALSQPYNVSAFGNYAGTESVSSNYFTSNSGSTTDIVDWVLLEIKNSSSVLVARRAAFIREDGEIVDLEGTSPVIFNSLESGSYYITLRHRNHLGISTENLTTIDSKALGVTASTSYTFDFSTESNTNIYGTSAAFFIRGSNNVMIGGNANSNNHVRYQNVGNDPSSILLYLNGVTTNIAYNVYTPNDVNMNGIVSYLGSDNDREFILTDVLGGVTSGNIFEQKR